MKSNNANLMKTNPDVFDDQDCRPSGAGDKFWDEFNKSSNEQLPDYLKQALELAKSKRQTEPQPA